MKNKLKFLAGIIMIPIVFAIGLMDRIVLMFLFWQESPSIGRYFRKTDQLIMAAWRIGFVIGIYLLAQIIKWIANGI